MAIAVAGLTAVLSAQPRNPSVQPQVDGIFKKWTRSTPGCAVGATVKGEPAVSAAYGMADLEHDIAIAPDTIFEAGSVSKQFTAAAVLLLARDGKLKLDDPVRKYIPELPDYGAPLTIRHMLTHTAGLRDWGSLAAIAGWPRGSRVHTHAHVLDIVSRQQSLNFPSGTRWSYSNSGYNLAAILVARVSGMSFAEFTKTRIFEPLAMHDTSWRDDFTRVVKRRATAYSERPVDSRVALAQGGPATFATDMPFENVHGNGGLLTTVADLLKWNENFASPKVGDAAFVDELERPAKFNDGRSHEYALGLYVDTYRGAREVDHSGATAGYRAHLSRYPDHGVSVAVLCNVGSANATTYAKAVVELLLPELRPGTPRSASHMLTDAEATPLVGLYRSTHPVGIATVARSETGLSVQGVGNLLSMSARRFESIDPSTYEFDGRKGIRVTDEFGTVTEYERVDPVKPTIDRLKAYVGRYVSDEIETTLTVAVDGTQLVLRRRPDSAIALSRVRRRVLQPARLDHVPT
jgi:CubicO group peptidase (beta-lactamase class C family)